jgi:hypothetical protein
MEDLFINPMVKDYNIEHMNIQRIIVMEDKFIKLIVKDYNLHLMAIDMNSQQIIQVVQDLQTT